MRDLSASRLGGVRDLLGLNWRRRAGRDRDGERDLEYDLDDPVYDEYEE